MNLKKDDSVAIAQEQCWTCKGKLKLGGDGRLSACAAENDSMTKKCSEHLTPEAVFAISNKCLASNCRKCQKPF